MLIGFRTESRTCAEFCKHFTNVYLICSKKYMRNKYYSERNCGQCGEHILAKPYTTHTNVIDILHDEQKT